MGVSRLIILVIFTGLWAPVAFSDPAAENFYERLGLSREASLPEIKAAYRSLSKKYHPDIPANRALPEILFKRLSEAYTTLSDAKKRAQYDRGLGKPIRNQPNPRSAPNQARNARPRAQNPAPTPPSPVRKPANSFAADALKYAEKVHYSEEVKNLALNIRNEAGLFAFKAYLDDNRVYKRRFTQLGELEDALRATAALETIDQAKLMRHFSYFTSTQKRFPHNFDHHYLPLLLKVKTPEQFEAMEALVKNSSLHDQRPEIQTGAMKSMLKTKNAAQVEAAKNYFAEARGAYDLDDTRAHFLRYYADLDSQLKLKAFRSWERSRYREYSSLYHVMRGIRLVDSEEKLNAFHALLRLKPEESEKIWDEVGRRPKDLMRIVTMGKSNWDHIIAALASPDPRAVDLLWAIPSDSAENGLKLLSPEYFEDAHAVLKDWDLYKKNFFQSKVANETLARLHKQGASFPDIVEALLASSEGARLRRIFALLPESEIEWRKKALAEESRKQRTLLGRALSCSKGFSFFK